MFIHSELHFWKRLLVFHFYYKIIFKKIFYLIVSFWDSVYMALKGRCFFIIMTSCQYREYSGSCEIPSIFISPASMTWFNTQKVILNKNHKIGGHLYPGLYMGIINTHRFQYKNMPFCSLLSCTWALILSLATNSSSKKPYKAIKKTIFCTFHQCNMPTF